MMVAECQRSDVRAPWREVFYHLPWRRYTRQQQYVAILINTVERFILTAQFTEYDFAGMTLNSRYREIGNICVRKLIGVSYLGS